LLKKAPISLIPKIPNLLVNLKDKDINKALAREPPNPIQNMGDKNLPLSIEPNKVFKRAMYKVLVTLIPLTTDNNKGKFENPHLAPGTETGMGKKDST
jgi:hypothetical protein